MAITDVASAESDGWRFVDNASVGGASATAHQKWGVRARKYEEVVPGKGYVWLEDCHSVSAQAIVILDGRQKKGQ